MSRILRLPSEAFSSRRFSVVKTPYFSIRTKLNTVQRPRMGVVAGKAAASTAVERNFLKRYTRETLQKEVSPGYDLLVVFFRRVHELTKKQLRDELRAAARKAQRQASHPLHSTSSSHSRTHIHLHSPPSTKNK